MVTFLLRQKALTCYLLQALPSSTLKHTFISQFDIFEVGMCVLINYMPLFNWNIFEIGVRVIINDIPLFNWNISEIGMHVVIDDILFNWNIFEIGMHIIIDMS